MTEEEYRKMTRNNYYTLMRASHCDSDGNPDHDFVYVTRCKDCKWFDCRNFVCNNDILAGRIADCGCYPNFNVEPDWFCADGERRNEDALSER